ncbi:15058_t:CDS:2 [Dentiscutata erythropus]|uniref:15058_t:CDS:1 n=1 Tax=Dentiscutata erythropus TaxID=1348616 RepID=A0A9N8Z451_9GLOM|nr:15058_t:CDS:2 [Dentiscutata erythropus]
MTQRPGQVETNGIRVENKGNELPGDVKENCRNSSTRSNEKLEDFSR